MKRLIETYRAVSSSQIVYFTNKQNPPEGATNLSLVSSMKTDTNIFEAPDPIESWSFDGENGLTGSGDGTLFVLATGKKQFGPGVNAGSLSLFFDGASSHSVPLTSSLILTGNMTISTLAFPCLIQGSTRNFVIFGGAGETSDVNYLYSLRTSSENQFNVFFETGAGGDVFIYPDPPAVIQPGSWHHIAYRRTEGTSSLFHNGRKVFTKDSGSPTDGKNSALHIGAAEGGAESFTGYLSQLKIYGRGLTDEQIQFEADAILGDSL